MKKQQNDLPLIKGGQGHTDEDLIASAQIFVWCVLGAGVVFAMAAIHWVITHASTIW